MVRNNQLIFHDRDKATNSSIFSWYHRDFVGVELILVYYLNSLYVRLPLRTWLEYCETKSVVLRIVLWHQVNSSFWRQLRWCSFNFWQESINQSLLNLLSYPWIQDRVRKELLSLHGGYYNFSNCSFEKWTLDFKQCNVEEGSSYVVKEQEFWCWLLLYQEAWNNIHDNEVKFNLSIHYTTI